MVAVKELWSVSRCPSEKQWWVVFLSMGTSAVQHLCQQHGQWKQVSPQQICWQQHTVWCSQHAGGKGMSSRETLTGLRSGSLGASCSTRRSSATSSMWVRSTSSRSRGQVENGSKLALGRKTWGRSQIEGSIRLSTCGQENQLCPGLHQKKSDQQLERGDSHSLFCSCDTPPGVLCPGLGPSTQEQRWQC